MERLGELYLELNRSQDAVPLLEKALEQEKIMFGLDHEETLLTMHNLGFALTQEGRIQEALTLLETVVETEKSKLGPDNESTLSSLTALGNVYEMAGKLEEAAHVQSEVLERRKKKDPKSPDFAAIAGSLGLNLLKQRKYAEAEPLLHECLAIRAEKLSDHWLRFNAQSMLGEALLGEKKYAEAEPLLLQGYEGMRHRERKIPAIGRIRLPEAAERLVHLYEATNQPEKAKKWRAELAECCEAIRLKKDYDKPHNDLGIAAAKSREAIRLKKYSAEAHNNLGIALSAKGHLDEAIAEFREAIRLKKDFAMAHNNLRAALRQVELDHELPAILSGKQQPADIGERLALAELCVMPHKKLYAAALKLYEEAFAADPRLVGEQPSTPRYNAACAAALAGCGQGKEADQTGDQARARLRRRSLNWLRAELTAWSKALQEQPDQARSALQQTIQHWQQDPDFNGVRDSQALAKLPPEEQEAWRNLWADVAKLLERARTIKEKDPEPVPPPKEVP
jgi:tetratricopeptide (TPR) repeat protein